MPILVREFQHLVNKGLIGGLVNLTDNGDFNTNSKGLAYVETTTFTGKNNTDKTVWFDFYSNFEENGTVYWPVGARIDRVSASADKGDWGTITFSFEGTPLVSWTTDEYYPNGSRDGNCIKYFDTPGHFFTTNPPWVNIQNGNDNVEFTLARGKTGQTAGKAYIDNIYFKLDCGFKGRYSFPETGGNSAGSFSGDAISSIHKVEPGTISKTLTFTPNTGYKIIGWQENGVTKSSLGTGKSISAVIDGKTVYRPIVQEIQHTIILKANKLETDHEGQVFVGENVSVGEYFIKDLTISTPSSELDFSSYYAYKRYYQFVGWEYNGVISNPLQLSAQDVIKDADLTREYVASYTPELYNYILDGKDYEGSVTTLQNQIGVTAPFPTPEARVGYTFVCWMNEKTREKFYLKDNPVIPLIEEETKYIAVFQKNYYELKFILPNNEGTWLNGKNPDGVYMDDPPLEIKIPTKPGYLTQWKIERLAEDKVTVLETTIIEPENSLSHSLIINSENKLIGNRIYTAEYIPIQYNLTYSGYSTTSNEQLTYVGNPGPPYLSFTNNNKVSLNDVSVSGYEFLGWSLVEDNPKPAVKSLVVNIEPSVNPYEENVNRAYKAYFQPIEYKIEFDYTHPAEEDGSEPIAPSYIPAANASKFQKMTIETKFSDVLEHPQATGYTFHYWRVYVKAPGKTEYEEIINARQENIIPRVLTDAANNWILGDYKYVAIYKPRVYNITYKTADPIHQRYLDGLEEEKFVLRQTYSTNKNRLLSIVDEITNSPIVVGRPGFEFLGFKRKNVLEEPVIDYVLEAHENTTDLEFELVFKEHRIKVEVIPILQEAKKEPTEQFKIIDKEKDDNYGVPWVEFIYAGQKYFDIKNNSITLDFEDGQEVTRILHYNPNRYVFLGWHYAGNKARFSIDVEGEENCIIKIKPTVDNSPSSNKYYAIFDYVDYEVHVRPECENTIGTGKYGALLVNKGNTEIEFEVSEDDLLPNDILESFNEYNLMPVQNSVRYMNNEYIIQNLHLDDEIELTMIPYSIPQTEERNKRYAFNCWEAKQDGSSAPDAVLKIIAGDKSWREQKSKYLAPKFSKIDFRNSVRKTGEDTTNDFQILNSILDKSIDQFVLINSIATLGSYGFYQCSDLRNAFLPGVKNVNGHAFDGCTNLNTLILSSSENGGTGEYSFKDCANLNLIILPSKKIALQSVFNEADINPEKQLEWSLFQKQLGRIYVPKSLLYEYLGSTNWCQYASIMRPIPETQNIIYHEPIPNPDDA